MIITCRACNRIIFVDTNSVVKSGDVGLFFNTFMCPACQNEFDIQCSEGIYTRYKLRKMFPEMYCWKNEDGTYDR
jgi:uncharacterized protein YlaI